jgi:hypothetical protein
MVTTPDHRYTESCFAGRLGLAARVPWAALRLGFAIVVNARRRFHSLACASVFSIDKKAGDFKQTGSAGRAMGGGK